MVCMQCFPFCSQPFQARLDVRFTHLHLYHPGTAAEVPGDKATAGSSKASVTGENAGAAEQDEVPTSLDTVLIQAQTDFATAVAMESTRLRLDILVPGLNEQIESRFPFDSTMLTESVLRLAAAIAPLRVCLFLVCCCISLVARSYQ